MYRKSNHWKSPLALATASTCAVALIVMPVTAQTATERGTQAAKPESKQSHAALLMTAENVLDREVFARTGDDQLGDMEKMIVNTRSGRAAFVIVGLGGVLGVGEKDVAIPYSALAWEPARQRFTLDATAEQLQNLPVFDSERLDGLHDPGWREKIASAFGASPEVDELENGRRTDHFSTLFAEDKAESMEGEIISVHRQPMAEEQAEYVIVTMRSDEDDAQHRLVLGPAWYVMSQAEVPSAGEHINVEAVQGRDDAGTIWIASSVELEDAEYELRDGEGRPKWMATSGTETHSAQTGRSHLMFVDDVRDASIVAANESIGGIDDVVIEVRSGTIAFLTTESGDLAGIGGDAYAVPWQATTVGNEGNFHVRMSKAEFESAPKLSEVQELNSPAYRQRIYSFFNVKEPQFKAPKDKAVSWSGSAKTGGWADGSEYNKCWEKGRATTLEGRVIAVEQRSPAAEMSEAVVLVIRGADPQPREVHLGPVWFIDEQGAKLEQGDQVKIEGVLVDWQGGPIIMARSVQSGDTVLVLRDEQGAPRWSAEK